MTKYTFDLVTKKGTEKISFDIKQVIMIGLSGRSREKAMEHVREMAEQGIPSPDDIPVVYQGFDSQATQGDITVCGDGTSGEIEFVIINHAGKTYVACGSDHTDRDLETQSICKSKFITYKPVSTVIWDYDELKDHWDSLKMESWQTDLKGERKPYQKGTAEDLLPLEDLVAKAKKELGDVEDVMIYSGTVPTVSGLWPCTEFDGVLTDEVLGRKIEFKYNVARVPNFM